MYVELPFVVAGIKKDLKIAVITELDADCYLGMNFIRGFQAVLDPCSNSAADSASKETGET